MFGFAPFALRIPVLESSKIKHLLCSILYFAIAFMYGSEWGFPCVQSELVM